MYGRTQLIAQVPLHQSRKRRGRETSYPTAADYTRILGKQCGQHERGSKNSGDNRDGKSVAGSNGLFEDENGGAGWKFAVSTGRLSSIEIKKGTAFLQFPFFICKDKNFNLMNHN